MARTFVILLIIFTIAFFGFEEFARNNFNATDVRVLGFSLFTSEFRLFLGGSVVFCEFAVLFFSMLDRIGNTIKAALIPIVRLLPMAAFVGAVYRMFSPIIATLIPEWAPNFGVTASSQATISQAVQTGVTGENVLLTLATMLLFVVITHVGRSKPSAEVQRLQAQVEKYRKDLRNAI